jgi:hypothetical protein
MFQYCITLLYESSIYVYHTVATAASSHARAHAHAHTHAHTHAHARGRQ